MSLQSVITFGIHDSNTLWGNASTDFVGFFSPLKNPMCELEATCLSTQALPQIVLTCSAVKRGKTQQHFYNCIFAVVIKVKAIQVF